MRVGDKFSCVDKFPQASSCKRTASVAWSSSKGMKGANKLALKKTRDKAILHDVESIKNGRMKEHSNAFKKCYSI